ncbi:phosphotyrosine protein phosphatase [Polaromonas sp.]|uniref:low molecular weight protein tyrosine phosphatase family protein n=1 Tax=Polaromonas sp. TaxID=1869339 RepID=UPI0032655284
MFSGHPGTECSSAGLHNGAENPLTPDLVEWADLIFVMERGHKTKLSSRFKKQLNGKRVICLDIPDNYPYMDPALIAVLKSKVTAFLPPA